MVRWFIRTCRKFTTCAPIKRRSNGAPVKADTIITWDAEARTRWTYKADPVDYDNWRSHAFDVIAGRAWEDDCDGLAFTVLDLVGDSRSPTGAPMTDRYMVIVASDPSKSRALDHMIGAVIDDAGGMWIVGDTAGPAYRAEECTYGPGLYWRLSDRNPDTGKPQYHGGFPWA
jgi:hypothetical protein